MLTELNKASWITLKNIKQCAEDLQYSLHISEEEAIALAFTSFYNHYKDYDDGKN